MISKCPSGKIRRVGYVRKDGVRVASTCVPDKGKPGKTSASRKVLPKPVSGNLSMFGYSNVKNTPAEQRRKALTRAVKSAGYATIIKRINLIANYNKLSNPHVHQIMRNDIKWMQKNLAGKYSKTATRKVSKKSSTRLSKKILKAGQRIVGGKKRQLYRLSGSDKKFYRYRKQDGKLGRRYV